MRRTAIGSAAVSAVTAVFLLAWYAAFDASEPSLSRGPRRRPPASRIPATASPRAGDAAGRPAGSLRILVHAEGRPLEGAILDLEGPGGGISARAASGNDGRAVLEGLQPGEWTVTARHPRFLTARARVSVAAGPGSDLAIELRPGGTAHGRVTDRQGRPLAGAEVSVLRGDPPEPLDPPRTARAGVDGRYRIEGIPLLELRLRFRSEGHRPHTTAGILFRFPGDAREVDAALEEGAVLFGRVEADGPLAGFTVILHRRDPGLGLEWRAEAKDFEDPPEGRFFLPDVAPGIYRLEVEAAGHEPLEVPTVEVRPGGAAPEVRVRLRRKN